LLGSNFAGEKPFNLLIQGLFNEKSKTNLFQVSDENFEIDVRISSSFKSLQKCTNLYVGNLANSSGRCR
jgi:hypothetical protein